MRLLAALEIFAPLANPFLPFQDEVRKLIGQFLRQEFQQRQPEGKIDLDVFMIFRLGEAALQNLGQQFAKRSVIQALRRAQFDARKISRVRALPDQVEQIVARGHHELRAEEHIVVDIVHPDRQRSHRDRRVIALQLDPRRFRDS